ncbi:MAG TPA: LamG-like jellyroll fold domain-containing protein [Candidatus Aquilonibacter sp.]|nr:LamG-like jellyroll fold domain-containing protein [Candidatus Aquilonibacter sp.]
MKFDRPASRSVLPVCFALLLAAAAAPGRATAQSAAPPPSYGPFDVRSVAGGIGVTKTMSPHDPLALSGSGWSLTLWVKPDSAGQNALLAGVGHPLEAFPRYIGLRRGVPFFWAGEQHTLEASAALSANTWHSIAVSIEGADTHLFVDGVEVAHAALPIGPATPDFELAPTETPDAGFHHFGGLLAEVSLARGFTAEERASLIHLPAGLDDLPFDDASKPWPVQSRQWIGYTSPQDPATLPRSAAPPQQPVAHPVPNITNPVSDDGRTLTLRANWRMAQASAVSSDAEHISSPSFDDSHWYAAVVPGTVLTTLVARGVYPDPDFGLNNMAIPESLAHEKFWYRTHFAAPASALHGDPTLTFLGINYHAQVWLNGHALGAITGAFDRGIFPVAGLLTPGDNTLAVLISPPPHPGIPHEQSLADGPGENGGLQAIDGPTFAATEGWDWIPAIRDRDMGIWQDVTLSAGGPVSLDNPQIITQLPLPDTSRAALTIAVPLTNSTPQPIHATLDIAFEGVDISKPVTLPPGASTITLTPADTPQLNIAHPRLWWPNGYGSPDLYHLTARILINNAISAELHTNFGIREITYELSLLDATGHLRRVEVDPTQAALSGKPLIDETHEGIRETPLGWVASLTAAGEHSPAVRDVDDLATQPALLIRVNGVRIAIRGGASGLEDMLKRVSPERLEPFFRLQRDAHLNIVRNWMGQNTEESFYDLADKYGLLVWNDFWDSTQDDNIEPDDSALFLRNARDTILRFRNHPSIAVWCGRNEGVPAPATNEGLIALIAELDGTRFYSASSNRVNLHDSGPYKYQEPSEYFTHLALGFAVEIGLPSPPTLEAFESFLPKADQWPISDDWAYHDWHQGGNGDTAPFMQAMDEEFGPPSSLADFDRKAQMLNYVGHRAVFEGFNANLWHPNTGRMLWMTQPAWPSTEWQIYSHDYDTHAAYYGVKLASEPIHIQLDLPDHEIAIINNTTAPLANLTVHAQVFDINSKLLFERTVTTEAAANSVSNVTRLALEDALVDNPVVFVKLTLTDAGSKLLSQNFYWLAAHDSDFRKLEDLAAVTLQASATSQPAGSDDRTENHIAVTLTNPSHTAALAAKLTLLDGAKGTRILPAYYSDNYVSLLPGEQRIITVAYPASTEHAHPVVALRGWNITPATITP